MSNLQPNKGPAKDQSGLRYPSNGKTIYHRPLNRTQKAELSAPIFAYLFSEMVVYAQRRVRGIQELETRLSTQGHAIGLKLPDLLLYREPAKAQQRPLNIIALLHFIKDQVWKHLFARQADRLEQSQANPDEYHIFDNEPVVNRYISVPRDMSQLNCAAYVAGIIEGVCDGAGFPAKVGAHSVKNSQQQQQQPGAEGGAGAANLEAEMWPGKTVFLLKFEKEVIEREGYLKQS